MNSNAELRIRSDQYIDQRSSEVIVIRPSDLKVKLRDFETNCKLPGCDRAVTSLLSAAVMGIAVVRSLPSLYESPSGVDVSVVAVFLAACVIFVSQAGTGVWKAFRTRKTRGVSADETVDSLMQTNGS